MEYFIVMLKLYSLAMLYPIVMLVVDRQKSLAYRIIEFIFVVLITWCLVYLGLPFSYSSWLSVLRWQLCALALVSLTDSIVIGMSSFSDEEQKITKTTCFISMALFFVVGAVHGVVNVRTSASNARTVNITNYSNTKTAPMPKVISKSKELPVVNSNATVKVQAQNSLSKVPNSNVYTLDHMRVQFYRGRLVYVAPLDFDGGYLKYRHYGEVSGYFIVDATKKDAKPKFVKQRLLYTPSAYFSHDATRKLYEKASAKGLTLSGDTPQLEITDDNTPYYVTTAVKRYGGVVSHIDFSSYWVVTVNALTGETSLYSANNKPKWLDIAVTPNVAKASLSQYSEYRNGWWNRDGWFASYQSGVMVPQEKVGTEANGALTPIAYKGKIYYFGTLTSAKKNQTSVLAYAYIDASNGKVYLYKEQSGAMTPDRAESLAENKMKQTQWKATMPLLYRINGQPTWVVSMVDQNKAFQSYVYLKADGNGTQDTTATGYNARDTLNKYTSLVKGGLTTTEQSAKGKHITKTGEINRVARFSNDTIRFMLKGSSVVYSVSIKAYPNAIFLKTNDKVDLKGITHDNIVTVDELSYK